MFCANCVDVKSCSAATRYDISVIKAKGELLLNMKFLFVGQSVYRLVNSDGWSPSCPQSAVDTFTFQPEVTQRPLMLKREVSSSKI